MHGGGAFRNDESFGDLSVAQAARNECCHLPFPWCQ
jgi:hypothetical protein